ncbi:MAG: HYR domain-containing protein, partial [Bacteroidia bacterium]|nr:HYR domain-containing protein [Bacteroidia bacterium]
CNNASTTEATFTIVDMTPPSIDTEAGDLVVECDGSGNISDLNGWLDSHGGASSSDICSNVTWTNNFMAMSDDCGATGTVTVIFTATDACNNASTTEATFTIVDMTPPSIDTEASDLVVECDGAGNTAELTSWLDSHGGTGVASDICSSVTWSHDFITLPFACASTGSVTVVFTATDACNNASTTEATFTIADTTPPAIICPDAIEVCADQDIVSGAIVSWTEPTPTDVCGSVIFVSTHDPGDVFDVGITTVSYTATDQCDHMSTCSFEIEVYELTELYISESELPIYCQENAKILTANIVSGTGVTDYSWSTGESGADMDAIHVQTSGTYLVTVTDINGCIRETSYDVIVTYGDLLSAYTIIGEDDVHLHGNNVVLNGGVGVIDDKGKAQVHDESFVTGPTTFVKSDKIEIDKDSGVDTEILEPVDVILPEFLFNPFDSDNDVTVDKNTSIVLTEQIYGKIDIKEGATVEFTQSDLFIEDLKTKEDVTIIFPSCAFVRIEKNLDFYKNVTVNPDGHQVQFYVDSNVEVKEGAVVNASIDARGHNMNVKGKEDTPTYMNGQYIGKKIDGDKYVTWDWATTCDPGCMPSDPPPNITCECKGGMIELVIDYAGGAGANLTVNDGTITDNGDGTYTVSNGREKLEKNFEIDDGTDLGEIHTSCSQDILGQTFAGVYTVVAHTDKYGNISTVEGCPDGVDFGPGSIEISMRNAGENTDFRVYPNPSGLGLIYVGIHGESTNDVKLILTDILGEAMIVHNQVVYKGNNVFELDVSHLNSGTYIVKLISDNHEMTTSIILMHN